MHYIIPDIWIDHNVIHFIVTSGAEFTADLFGFNALTMTRLQRQCSSDGDRYPPKKARQKFRCEGRVQRKSVNQSEVINILYLKRVQRSANV